MTILPTVRKVVLGTSIGFSVLVLALSAHTISTTEKYLRSYFIFSAMSVATALLTLLSVPVMLYIDSTRKGALTSMIVVELGWLGVLWVLWLASAGLAAEATGLAWPSGCGFADKEIDTYCREFPAVTAFDFLTWIMLFAYTIALLVMSIMANSRGNNVWYQSVNDADFSGSNTTAVPPVKHEYTGSSTTAQQQVAGYPSNTVVTPQPSMGFPQPTVSPAPGSPYIASPGLPQGAQYPTQPGTGYPQV